MIMKVLIHKVKIENNSQKISIKNNNKGNHSQKKFLGNDKLKGWPKKAKQQLIRVMQVKSRSIIEAKALVFTRLHLQQQ